MKLVVLLCLVASSSANDCWKRRPVWKNHNYHPPSVSLLEQGQPPMKNTPATKAPAKKGPEGTIGAPGWGIKSQTTAVTYGKEQTVSKIVPFETVTKDGFLLAGCFKDYMVSHGDYHGANKYEYTNKANVSIIWYDGIVPKEDQQPMSPKVCYEFCRTVKGASFFGVVYGRQCYCSLYVQQMAGDSSDCDAVCEGDNTQMCGGMKKSNVYAMHMCADTAEDLKAAKHEAAIAEASCDTVSNHFEGFSKQMQTMGACLQKRAGNNGDPAGGNWGQLAKVGAGDADKYHNAAAAVVKELKKLKFGEFKGKDFSKNDVITKAEATMESGHKLSKKANALCTPGLSAMAELVRNDTSDKSTDIKEYYPVTYFIESDEKTKEVSDLGKAVPSTCKAKMVKDSLVSKGVAAKDMNDCARLCDDFMTDGEGNKCMGFQYYNGRAKGDAGLCFLYNDIDEIAYYAKGQCEKSPVTCDKVKPIKKKVQKVKPPPPPPSKGMPPFPMGFLQVRRGPPPPMKNAPKKKKDPKVKAVDWICMVKFSLAKGLTHRINTVAEGVKNIPVKKYDRCF